MTFDRNSKARQEVVDDQLLQFDNSTLISIARRDSSGSMANVTISERPHGSIVSNVSRIALRPFTCIS